MDFVDVLTFENDVSTIYRSSNINVNIDAFMNDITFENIYVSFVCPNNNRLISCEEV